MSNKDVPVGIKLISQLYYIGALYMFLYSLSFLFFQNFLYQIREILHLNLIFILTESSIVIRPLELRASILSYILISIIYLISSIIYFYIAKKFYKGENFSRMIILILSIAQLIFTVYMFISLITLKYPSYGLFWFMTLSIYTISFIINSLIIGYLTLNKNVKAYFTIEKVSQ